jgi:hypothetical protein
LVTSFFLTSAWMVWEALLGVIRCQANAPTLRAVSFACAT